MKQKRDQKQREKQKQGIDLYLAVKRYLNFLELSSNNENISQYLKTIDPLDKTIENLEEKSDFFIDLAQNSEEERGVFIEFSINIDNDGDIEAIDDNYNWDYIGKKFGKDSKEYKLFKKRSETIGKIILVVLNFQKEYFKNLNYRDLKPMILNDIKENVNEEYDKVWVHNEKFIERVLKGKNFLYNSSYLNIYNLFSKKAGKSNYTIKYIKKLIMEIIIENNIENKVVSNKKILEVMKIDGISVKNISNYRKNSLPNSYEQRKIINFIESLKKSGIRDNIINILKDRIEKEPNYSNYHKKILAVFWDYIETDILCKEIDKNYLSTILENKVKKEITYILKELVTIYIDTHITLYK